MPVTVRPHTTEVAFDTTPFKELLLRTCGQSFENERGQSLVVGLCRRMAALEIDEPATYYVLLLRDQDELLRLTELLTVNETYFFREPDHLALIVNILLPEIAAGRKQGPIRIVSAGCSTGEEPYSIAIMLRERFGAGSEQLFAITGADIDSTVIATAKKGIYGKSSFRGMDGALLERYFEPCGSGTYKVSDIIRKLVGFEVVNLLSTSYPHTMHLPDIILYRNVSIYFPGKVQREVFRKLAELLNVGGCLLVGASETGHHDIGVLSLEQRGALFYYRKKALINNENRRTSNSIGSCPDRKPVPSPPGRDGYPLTSAAHRGLTHRLHTHEKHKPDNRDERVSENSSCRNSTGQNIGERYEAAVDLARKKQNDKALAIIDAIIEQDGTFEKAYSLKGGLLLSLSRFDEAYSVCSRVLSRDALCLEAYLMLGIIARQKGDNDDAIRRFREAIYLDSSCWPAHFYTAEIYYAQRDEKHARSSYEAAVRTLEKMPVAERDRSFFPLSFNEEHFVAICRHKLTLLSPQRDKRVNQPAK